MPTKSDLQNRLTAARAEIKRLQQCKADLSKMQASLHSKMVECDALRRQVKGATTTSPDSDTIKELQGKLSDATIQVRRAKSERDDALNLASKLSCELSDSKSYNEVLRGQYKPTSAQVKLCLAEIDRLKSLIGSD